MHPTTDCAPSVSGVSDRSGGGVASLQVHTGSVLAANAKSSFTCDHTTACTIAVFVDETQPITPTTAATTVIEFAFPADDCPHGNAGINGTGAEAVNRAMLAWEASVCQPPESLDLQYTRTESEDGKAAFIGRPGITRPDFAVTSVPFSATDLGDVEVPEAHIGLRAGSSIGTRVRVPRNRPSHGTAAHPPHADAGGARAHLQRDSVLDADRGVRPGEPRNHRLSTRAWTSGRT